ncbi:MAG: Hsp20/alpha crystallin family protein [Desulfobacterales bacterium]|nr:Hsp20/alpha crystallin family protein [Desulfobacterales bacterium]
MKLVNYTPFNEFNRLARTMDDMFGWNSPKSCRDHWAPAVDIKDEKDQILLTVDLPGMDKEDIQIKMENRVLTIEGERRTEEKKEDDRYYLVERRNGKFSRAFNLSDKISVEEVDAKYEAGVLTITLKKDVPEETVKQIAIH